MMDKPLVRGGSIGTAIYLLGLGTYIHAEWEVIRALAPNELGDFFAGAVGPLATIWLVLGFFQQRLELKQNTAALHMQASELRASVEQQRALVGVAREDFEANRRALDIQLQQIDEQRAVARKAALPRLYAQFARASSDPESARWYFSLQNGGPPCTDVAISLETDAKLKIFSRADIPFLGTSQTADISLRMQPPSPPAAAKVEVRFVDSLGNLGTSFFEVKIQDTGLASISPLR